jgi:hypothetical protein
MKARHSNRFTRPLALMLLLALPLAAANNPGNQPNDSDSGGNAKDKTPSGSAPAFVYRPPNRGAPARRVGGGTRSINPLSALSPPHIGLTSNAQPQLYWYIASGFQNPLRFRLNAMGDTAPLLEIALEPKPVAGIYGLDLAKHGINLQPGEIYQWVVMLDPLPHQRWHKIVSSGQIERSDATVDLSSVAEPQRPFVAAQNALWYDALEGISKQIEADPRNPLLRRQRADLLAQGGLMEASLLEGDRAADLER